MDYLVECSLDREQTAAEGANEKPTEDSDDEIAAVSGSLQQIDAP